MHSCLVLRRYSYGLELVRGQSLTQLGTWLLLQPEVRFTRLARTFWLLISPLLGFNMPPEVVEDSLPSIPLLLDGMRWFAVKGDSNVD